MIQLETKEEKSDENQDQDFLQNRPGIDLISVIDTSGSMMGEKINLVQNTL